MKTVKQLKRVTHRGEKQMPIPTVYKVLAREDSWNMSV